MDSNLKSKWSVCAALLMFLPSWAQAQTNSPSAEETLAGPAWADFNLTLEAGRRQEGIGPFFSAQETKTETQRDFPPFLVYTHTPDVDATAVDSLYPIFTRRSYGSEYRIQLLQLLSFNGGQASEGPDVHHFTIFPIYFQQRSTNDPALNYTAVVPFYGHLENRLFHDDIKFVMFPAYAKTRKKDVITENYLYPIYHRRYGGNVTGWQVWPLVGAEKKTPNTITNTLGDSEIVGGYKRLFLVWPFYLKETAGIGTTNQQERLVVVPFYNRLRSPLRDETSYGWPFGYWRIDDRGENIRERDFFWPLYEFASGEKTTTRIFPFYSKAKATNGLETGFYLWPAYLYRRMDTPAVVRERDRVAFFLYSNLRETNLANGEYLHRVDFWPFYTYQRDMDQKSHLQIFSILEPFFPGNEHIVRGYAPLYSLWRTENNPTNGAASQSLLWNIYRHETAPGVKKFSLFFGLIQYQSGPSGANWRVCYIPFGKKQATIKP